MKRVLPLVLLAACATSPDTRPAAGAAPVDDGSPRAVSPEALDGLARRFRCEADRSDIDGLTAVFAECYDDNLMVAFVQACEGESARYCTMDGMAQVILEAEGEAAKITPETHRLPVHGATPLYRVQAREDDEPIEVLFVDQGLPEGVALAICGWKDTTYAALCDDLLDELLTGQAAPERGALEARAELDDDDACTVKDMKKAGVNAGWMALCGDFVAFLVYDVDVPELRDKLNLDAILAQLAGDTKIPPPEAVRLDLAHHKGAKLYRINALNEASPGLAYFVDQDLHPGVKLGVCAWQKDRANDARCLALIDRLLR